MPNAAPLILVVDDVADLREMYALYLTTHGYRGIEAADEEHALRLTLEQRPALVLMDMGLPKDGRLASHAPHEGRSRNAPYSRAGPLRARLPRLRAPRPRSIDAFFRKPCLPSTVLAKIREMLRVLHF